VSEQFRVVMAHTLLKRSHVLLNHQKDIVKFCVMCGVYISSNLILLLILYRIYFNFHWVTYSSNNYSVHIFRRLLIPLISPCIQSFNNFNATLRYYHVCHYRQSTD
jgi:hypothetical protein